MTPFELVCSHLRIAHLSGSIVTAHCPGPQHRRGDVNPSLSVTEAADGKVLLKCHVGCTAEEIVGKVNLEMRDLFPTNGMPSRDYGGGRAAVCIGDRTTAGAEADDGDEAGARAAALRADEEDEPGADDEAGRPYAQNAGPDPWDEDSATASQASHEEAQRARLPQNQRNPAGAAGSPPGGEIATAGRQGASAVGHPAPAAPGDHEPVTVALLADRFKLDLDHLRSLGLRDVGGTVLVPYHDETGAELYCKRRMRMTGDPKYIFRKGTQQTVYGLIGYRRLAQKAF